MKNESFDPVDEFPTYPKIDPNEFDREYDEHADNHLFSILFVIGFVLMVLGVWKAVEIAETFFG